MSGETARPRVPKGLRTGGRKLWRDVVEAYELTAPELRLLGQVCVTIDAIDELDELVSTEGTMTVGSKGQPVLHPAVAEARLQRLALGRLLAQLCLPDPEGGVVRSPAQVRARRAAQVRWRAQARREGVG